MGGVCLYPWGGSVCLLSGGKDAIRGLRMSFLFLGCFADEAFRPLALWSVASRALTPHPLPSTLTPNTRRPPAQSVEAPSPPPRPSRLSCGRVAEGAAALCVEVWRVWHGGGRALLPQLERLRPEHARRARPEGAHPPLLCTHTNQRSQN